MIPVEYQSNRKPPRLSPLLLLSLFFFTPFTLYGANSIRVHVLDVGYGQAVHIETPIQNFLIDSGSEESVNKIMDHLSKMAVTRLDAVFISHAHPDHIGGLFKIASQIKTDVVYWNEIYPPSEEIVIKIDDLETKTELKKINPGARIILSKNLSITVLENRIKGGGMNDSSLVLGLSFHKQKLLFPADAGLLRQKNLAELEFKWLQKVNFMMWPHHGDTLDNSFLDILENVDICVVSVGENPYELPASTLGVQAKKLCENLLRTDESRDLTFLVKKKKTLFVPRKKKTLSSH